MDAVAALGTCYVTQVGVGTYIPVLQYPASSVSTTVTGRAAWYTSPDMMPSIQEQPADA